MDRQAASDGDRSERFPESAATCYAHHCTCWSEKKHDCLLHLLLRLLLLLFLLWLHIVQWHAVSSLLPLPTATTHTHTRPCTSSIEEQTFPALHTPVFSVTVLDQRGTWTDFWPRVAAA